MQAAPSPAPTSPEPTALPTTGVPTTPQPTALPSLAPSAPTAVPTTSVPTTSTPTETPCGPLGLASACGLLFCNNFFASGLAPGSVSVPPPTVPPTPVTFLLQDVSGTCVRSPSLSLVLDPGNFLGSRFVARVSYDCTGDGSFDRNESFLFATDPNPGLEAVTVDTPFDISGSECAPIVNGVIAINIWYDSSRNATLPGVLGTDGLSTRGASQFTSPYNLQLVRACWWLVCVMIGLQAAVLACGGS